MHAHIAGHHVMETNTQQINLRMVTPLKTDSPHSINTELMESLPTALIITKLSTVCLTVGIAQMKCI